MKFRDAKIDMSRALKAVLRHEYNLENAQDYLNSAYLKLFELNKDFNDTKHAFSVLLLEAKFQNLQYRQTVDHGKRNELAAQWFYSKKYTEIDTFEANNDAKVYAKELKKSSEKRASIFMKMFLDGEISNTHQQLSSELGMNENNFKVQLCKTRKLLKEYVKNVYYKPNIIFNTANSIAYNKEQYAKNVAKYEVDTEE